jgi:IPT/TIG domain
MIASTTVRRLSRILIFVVLLPLFASATAFAQPGSVTLNPPEGPPGTTVTATGTGFPPGAVVVIIFVVPPAQELIETAVDQSGAWQTAFTVPPNAAVGPHEVIIEDDEGLRLASALFTVAPG